MIDITSRTLFGKVLRFPLRLIPRNQVLPILTGPLRGWKWIARSSVHGCWLGTYEKEITHHLARERVKGTVLDIGANCGYYTLLLSRLVGDRGQVISFEPAEINIEFIDEHLRLNNCRNVRVLRKAVSDFVGKSQFSAGNNASEGRLSGAGQYEVEVATIDSLNLRPSLVKIDVEGSEVEVLRGMERTLTEAKPVIYLATHSADLKHQCVENLRRLNYSIVDLGDEVIARPSQAAP